MATRSNPAKASSTEDATTPPVGNQSAPAAAATAETPPANATTLDSDVTKPSVTAPGDGAADTTDPTEIAVSVPPQPGDEALAVGTVNAVKPVAATPAPAVNKGKERTETYEAVKPDGSVVKVRRNIDTGESSLVEQ